MHAPDTAMSREEAEALIVDALVVSNVSDANAVSVAKALVAAEIDGQKGHGFSRVVAYAAQARSGKVNGHAEPDVTRTAPAFLSLDAKNGFAFPAIDRAIEELAGLAPDTGIAAAGITRSHHCGQLSAHVERLAERGCLALMVSNTPKAMAPWGGIAPLFGTNPIAFAAPRENQPPLVIDLSLSKVARGKVMAANQRGEHIPEGWALDASGDPTTDPKAALQGSMVPAGDAKGAALALIVEVLAASLTGACYSFEAASFFDAEGEPPGVGHLIIAIHADRVAGAGFPSRLEVLLSAICDQDGARLPGERRLEQRAICNKDGVLVPPHLLSDIRKVIETHSSTG